jgi:cell division protein FtsQ
MVLLAATGWGLSWLLRPDIWPVKTVRIQGELRHLSQARLRKLISAQAAEGFFGMDLSAVQRAVASQSWVRSVTVRRLWPDTVGIEVQEHVAVARWGESALVNRQGELFFPPRESFPQGLPRWEGPEGTEALVRERYRGMAKMLVPLGLRIVTLSLDERRAWRVRLANGIDIKLGRGREMERLAHFARVYPTLLADQAPRIAVVDLRYKNGFTVHWRSSPQAPRHDTAKKA